MHKISIGAILAFISLVFYPDYALAQLSQGIQKVALVELPEIRVTSAGTATRTERELDLISKSVSVLTKDKIETRNAKNVQELLEEIPGVSFSRAGGLGGQIVMRGFNSNIPRTLLLVDGDRFRGRNTLEYNLLDPNQIERIEVIRGPGSAMYGPDAMAGVVNIITRKAMGDSSGSFRLAPRLRSIDYNSVNNLLGTREEAEVLGHGIDGLVGVSYRQADNFNSPSGQIRNSDFDLFQTDLRLGYSPVASHRIEITGKFAEVKSGRAGGIGAAPGLPLIGQREDPLREHFGKLAYQGRLDNLGLEKVEASVYGRQLYSHLMTDNRTQANRLIESSNIVDGPLVIGGKIFTVKSWSLGALTFGMDFFNESRKGARSGNQTTTFNTAGNVIRVTGNPLSQNAPDATQTDIGLFAHNDWDPLPMVTVSAGGRLDYIRTTTETNPLLDPILRQAYERGSISNELPLTGDMGLIYRPWDILHFTANIGKSFRVPSTIESFGSSRQGTGFNVPNPDLKPEEGVTYEIGARLRLPIVNVNMTAFRSEYTNFVVRQPITFQGLPSFQNQNAGEARIQGLEFDATWAVTKGWEILTNTAYLYGTDTGTSLPLSYIPPFNGLVGLKYTLPEQGAYLEGLTKWSLRKDRIDDTLERETAGYAVLNLYAGIDLAKASSKLPKMSLRIGLENVLNQVYRQPTTIEDIKYPVSNTNPLIEPGRAFLISLKSNF